MYKSLNEFYKEIWEEREHICFVTERGLDGIYNSSYWLNIFAHVLAKAQNKYPEWKLYKHNIVLVHPQIHNLYDNAVLDVIQREEQTYGFSMRCLFELELELHEQYLKEFNDLNTGDNQRQVEISFYNPTLLFSGTRGADFSPRDLWTSLPRQGKDHKSSL